MNEYQSQQARRRRGPNGRLGMVAVAVLATWLPAAAFAGDVTVTQDGTANSVAVVFATGYGKDVPARDFRWGHGGSTDGICTDVRHYPATGETVIVLSNKDAPACFAVSGLLHAQWKQP